MSIFEDLSTATDTVTDGLTPPSQKQLDWLHGRASINRPEDLHHMIGFGAADAAAGDHTHNGKNSKFLFDSNTVLTDLGPAPTSAQIQAAVNALNALFRLLGTS